MQYFLRRFNNRCMVLIVATAGFQFVACQRHAAEHHMIHPAEVEHIEGSDLARLTLTERAIERLALATDEVREADVSRSSTPRKVVPYSSLIYDPEGNTWVYESPEPRVFVRRSVIVDYIEGNIAVLNEGPPTGTVVASVGVAELYGTEFEVGH